MDPLPSISQQVDGCVPQVGSPVTAVEAMGPERMELINETD